MTFPPDEVRRFAIQLLEAEASGQPIEPLQEHRPELDVDAAYAIQDVALRLRHDRGERTVGMKLGLTSRAKQQRMGISSPLTAWLTDAMVGSAGAPLGHERLIHPRAEPEIVFIMGDELKGPGVTAPTALRAVEYVCGGIEVIDSRFRDFRFSLPDVIADNASSSSFVTGPKLAHPADLDLSLEACVVEVDGVVMDSATGAAVLGHPAEALALAANHLGRRGHAIEAGWIILTGGMTDAVPLGPRTSIVVEFTNLGITGLGRNGSEMEG